MPGAALPSTAAVEPSPFAATSPAAAAAAARTGSRSAPAGSPAPARHLFNFPDGVLLGVWQSEPLTPSLTLLQSPRFGNEQSELHSSSCI